MKNNQVLMFLFLLIGINSYGQKYDQGISTLSRVKIQCEDIANSVKLTWRRNSVEYKEVQLKYKRVQNSIITMIDAFDSKIRSGKKITKNDIDEYIGIVKNENDNLASYYNANKQVAGPNSAFNLTALFITAQGIADNVISVIDKYQNYVIEKRLATMHAALDKSKLKDWDSI